MSAPTSIPEKPKLHETSELSLVLGGPLYQILRRTHLTGDTPRLLGRRALVFVLLVWAPLLILSVVEKHAWGPRSEVLALPFLYDIELHARLLLALPLLIVAELVVHQRMRPVVRQFIDRGLIPAAARPRFDAAVTSATRLRNSITAEVLLIAFVYVVGVGFFWRTQVALDVSSWYGVGVGGRLQPTLAGWWMGLVSLPLFQFLLLRWYFRLFIWTRFLWQVSRIELDLIPTHPDRCGGLGFLSLICYAFSPLLLAQGTLLAGLIANRIFFTGAALLQFKVEVSVLVGVMMFVVLAPLLVFIPRLAAVKRVGLDRYGTLAERYAREFDQKWIHGRAPADHPFLGSTDIQSLADLDRSYEVVKSMWLVPINLQTVARLAVTTLLPVAPLTLTMISFEQLLGTVLKFVF